MAYNDSNSSDSDESYYKHLENYINNDNNDAYKNDEHAYHTQLKKNLGEKYNEMKNEEMNLHNITLENSELTVS